jgi:hypothetical protein
MMWMFPAAVAAMGLGVLCLPAHQRWEGSVRDEQTIEKTAALPNTGQSSVLIDNVSGYVHVSGTARSEVCVKAHKTIRAGSDADLQQARNEVTLRIEETPGSVSIIYDAPWRCRNHSGPCESGRHSYDVSFDIEVEVPQAARLTASTVNGGDVNVTHSDGAYAVRNVNGAISMSDIAGSGTAETVNGSVTVRFRKNPQEKCLFKSVNGALDAYFHPNLSANLLLKTLNGGVFTDFEVAARAAVEVQKSEHTGGRFVYRSSGLTSARAGSVGPEYSFQTLNGDIRLHQQE